MFTYTTQLRILFKSRNLSFPQYIGTLSRYAFTLAPHYPLLLFLSFVPSDPLLC